MIKATFIFVQQTHCACVYVPQISTTSTGDQITIRAILHFYGGLVGDGGWYPYGFFGFFLIELLSSQGRVKIQKVLFRYGISNAHAYLHYMNHKDGNFGHHKPNCFTRKWWWGILPTLVFLLLLKKVQFLNTHILIVEKTTTIKYNTWTEIIQFFSSKTPSQTPSHQHPSSSNSCLAAHVSKHCTTLFFQAKGACVVQCIHIQPLKTMDL